MRINDIEIFEDFFFAKEDEGFRFEKTNGIFNTRTCTAMNLIFLKTY